MANVEVFRLRSSNLLNPKNSHASPTPIVEGNRVYVHFGAEGTAAIDAESGAIVWKARFPYASQHGAGGSPALYKDLLIFSGDGHYEAFVIALDKQTGKVRWKTERRKPFDQAYTTPLVIRVGDRDQLVSIGAYRAAAVRSADGQGDLVRQIRRRVFQRPATGLRTWSRVHRHRASSSPRLSPFAPDGTGDVTGSHIAWSMTRGAPFTPSPLLVGDELYVISDLGVLTCVDAKTGKVHWQQRIGGNHSASPIFADGRIYFLSEEGVATVIAPGKTFEKLAVNELDGATLASMAVSRGSIFIRSHTHLYRIGSPKSRVQSP